MPPKNAHSQHIYTHIYNILERQMATHSSVVACEIPWTEETGGLHTVHGVTKSQT